MGTLHRNIKKLPAQNVGGADTAADHGSSCTINTSIRTLGTAQTEFHNAIALCGIADPRCLGCDQTLMIDDIQDRSFYKLGFHDGSDHLDKRLSRKNDCSLRNGINITRETEICQIVEKIRIENTKTGKVTNIMVGKVKILDVFYKLLQSGGNGITAVTGIVAVKGIKDNSFVAVLVLEVALHHGELIKISEQGQVLSVHKLLPSETWFKSNLKSKASLLESDVPARSAYNILF